MNIELEHDDEKARLLDLLADLYYAWCDVRGEVSDTMDVPRHTSPSERALANDVCAVLHIETEDYWEDEAS